jgi:putative modified peptide
MFDNIEPLIDRWIDDNGFRAALQRDPEAALRAAGVSLTKDEQAALRAIDWAQSDEQLTARVSKCVGQ